MTAEFSVIDLFSGAGGLSEGFFRKRYKFLAHIDMNSDAASTVETRSAYYSLSRKKEGRKVYREYLLGQIDRAEFLKEAEKSEIDLVINLEITPNTQRKIAKKIEKNMEILGLKDVDLIIGGPPCQAYSIAGRSRLGDRIKEDPRNYLFQRYVYFLRRFKPKIFIFENVPGIRTAVDGMIHPDFLARVDRAGYRVEERILDASDFGVLQRRKRVIIVGWKKDIRMAYPHLHGKKHGYMVSSVLDDLPPLEPGTGTDEVQDYAAPPSKYLKRYGLRTEKDLLRHHYARSQNERDREIYRYAIRIWNEEKRRLAYNELPENLKTHKNRQSFQDRFKVVAADLTYSQTITAHISKDGHYYIHPDIKQARSLTVREAARLQSFPDNFIFEGSRTSKYRQIGNAVPPLMSYAIAKEIKQILEEL